MNALIRESFSLRVQVVLLGLLGLLTAAPLAAAPQEPPTTPARPNVLWITIDDAGPDLGCYGVDVVPTPRIDALAARGQRFERCWTTTPVCSPARSALITGCTPQAIGSQHHRSARALPEPVRPVTALLADAGYDVVALPFERQRPAEFARGEAAPEGRFATVTGSTKEDFNFSRAASLFSPWAERDEAAPFFALIDFNGPKTGQGTGRAHAWAEATGQAVDPTSLTLMPYWVDAPAVREAYARYFEGLALLDAEVGRALAWLAAEGLAEDTWVFIWGDHGLALARHKQWCYESGLRVPLIAAGPGLAAGVRTDLVSSLDLAATTLGVCGLAVPEWMEGRDLFAADHAPRQLLFAGRDRCDETEDRVRAVRDERYSLIHNLRPELPWLGRNDYTLATFPGEALLLAGRDAGTLTAAQAALAAATKPAWELFDLQADPLQLQNLAGQPAHAAVEARLRAALSEWTARVDARNPYPEDLATIVPDKARAAVEAARAADAALKEK